VQITSERCVWLHTNNECPAATQVSNFHPGLSINRDRLSSGVSDMIDNSYNRGILISNMYPAAL